MKTDQHLLYNENLFAFITILLFVSIPNFPSIFNLNILLSDDNARYLQYIEGVRVFSSTRTFIGISTLLKSFGVYLYSGISAELARAFYVLVYMIPLSYLLYYFNRYLLRLPFIVALGPAVIANIIPKQTQIPAFIDGSYPVIGVPVLILTIILILSYIKSDNKSYLLLLSSLFLWVLSNDVMGEMGIFFFPVLIFLILTEHGEKGKKLLIFIPVTIITSLRIFSYIASADNVNTPVRIQFSESLSRLSLEIDTWLPYKSSPFELQIIFISLSLVILIFASSLLIPSSSKFTHKRALGCYIVWFLSTSFPFIFMTKYLTIRNFYFAHIALTVIFGIFIYQIFTSTISKQKYYLYPLLFISMTFYGYQRIQYTNISFDKINFKNKQILSLLENIPESLETQIALINIDNGTGGHYLWSSGYFAYILKNPFVRGIIGENYNFYNPFYTKGCYFRDKMSCLSVSNKLIAYKILPDMIKKEEMYYFLKWENKNDIGSNWVLFDNKNNYMLSIVDSGKGLDSYRLAIKNAGINSKKVLWGNLNDISPFK